MAIAKRFLILIMAVGFVATGCRTADLIFPDNSKVQVYPLAFDITYLRALEAIESLKDWDLTYTEKERGIINTRNVDYARVGDADTRNVTILIKRVGRRETGVELFRDSKKVIGGGKILEEVDYFLSLEVEKDTLIRQRQKESVPAPIMS